MTLYELMTKNSNTDAVLADPSALEAFVSSQESTEQLVMFLADHINNRLSEHVLLLDNYITIEDEEMTLLEAILKQTYISLILSAVSKRGNLGEMSQALEYQQLLAANINEATNTINFEITSDSEQQ